MPISPISLNEVGEWVEEIEVCAEEAEGKFEGELECQPCEAERVSPNRGPDHLKKMIDPKLPTQKEVDEHYLTHLPYRNWCPICVKSKGKEMDHRDASRRSREF